MFHDSLLQQAQPSSPSFKRWKEVPLRSLLAAALVGAIIGWMAASLPSSSIGLTQSVVRTEAEHLEVDQPARWTYVGMTGDTASEVQLGACRLELSRLKQALSDVPRGVDVSSRAMQPAHQRRLRQNATD